MARKIKSRVSDEGLPTSADVRGILANENRPPVSDDDPPRLGGYIMELRRRIAELEVEIEAERAWSNQAKETIDGMVSRITELEAENRLLRFQNDL